MKNALTLSHFHLHISERWPYIAPQVRSEEWPYLVTLPPVGDALTTTALKIHQSVIIKVIVYTLDSLFETVNWEKNIYKETKQSSHCKQYRQRFSTLTDCTNIDSSLNYDQAVSNKLSLCSCKIPWTSSHCSLQWESVERAEV